MKKCRYVAKTNLQFERENDKFRGKKALITGGSRGIGRATTILFAKAGADVAIDIAGPILFLASDLARHITGEVVNVSGGSVMCA